MKKTLNYNCINGAYHVYACCNTCWNTHPVAEKYFRGEDFSMSKVCERLQLKQQEMAFKLSARLAGFSESEIDFLSERV